MLTEPPVPVLVLSYNNCELHCCHLDGYKRNRQAFLARLDTVEQYFVIKPVHRRYRLWFNLDETMLDDRSMERVAASLANIHIHIIKIAFIGIGKNKRRRFERMLKNYLRETELPRQYFCDAEKAKEWLR